jgi:hypothetical protein
VGGSHAQWELFEETLLAAYLALARYDDAQRLVGRRLRRRPSPRDLRLLEQCAAPDAPGQQAGRSKMPRS